MINYRAITSFISKFLLIFLIPAFELAAQTPSKLFKYMDTRQLGSARQSVQIQTDLSGELLINLPHRNYCGTVTETFRKTYQIEGRKYLFETSFGQIFSRVGLEPSGTFRLTVGRNDLGQTFSLGRINAYDIKQSFELRVDGTDGVLTRVSNTGLAPVRVSNLTAPTLGILGDSGVYRPGPGGTAEINEPPDRSPLDQIDLELVFTPQAKSMAGGEFGIMTEMANGVASANHNFAASLVRAKIEPVFVYQLAQDESGNSVADLEALQTRDDGRFDEVHYLRAAHGADVVLMYVGVADEAHSDQGLGLAYQPGRGQHMPPDYSFGVVKIGMDNFESLSHMLGHIMGSAHNNGFGAHEYSNSFEFVRDNIHFLSVMAPVPVWHSSVKLDNFSNPDLIWSDGTAMGDALHNNAESLRDEKQLISTLVDRRSPILASNNSFEMDLGFDYFPNYEYDDQGIANQKPDGWTDCPLWPTVLDSSEGVDDFKAAKLYVGSTYPDHKYTYLYQDVPVEPGKSYIVSGYVRIKNDCYSDPNCFGTIVSECLDAQHEEIWGNENCALMTAPQDRQFIRGDTDWHAVSFTIKADNPNAKFARILCYNSPRFSPSMPGGTGTVLCDGITMLEATEGGGHDPDPPYDGHGGGKKLNLSHYEPNWP